MDKTQYLRKLVISDINTKKYRLNKLQKKTFYMGVSSFNNLTFSDLVKIGINYSEKIEKLTEKRR